MKIIGIHGKARSGKDELSRILCSTYGFTKVSFADKVKEFGMDYFGLTYDECFKTKTKESRAILQGIGTSIREDLSFVAQHIDELDPVLGVSGFPTWIEKIATEEFYVEPVDLKSKKKFVKTVLNGIQTMWKDKWEYINNVTEKLGDTWIEIVFLNLEDQIYVIPDVRFKNEKRRIESVGGKLIKIIRIDKPDIEIGEEHSSETDLDDDINWDFVITNEHKTDWRNGLVLAASNIVRKLSYEGFFTDEEKARFKISL